LFSLSSVAKPEASLAIFGQPVPLAIPIFFNFNFFKLFIKLTPGELYLHQMTTLAVPADVARQLAFVASHAAARQLCHAGEARRAEATWAQACRTTCNGAAALPCHVAWRSRDGPRAAPRLPFFLLLPFFLSQPRPSRHHRPPPPFEPQIRGFGVGKVGEIVPRVLVKVFPYSPSFTVALCRLEKILVT
jgi:hypothetical protein